MGEVDQVELEKAKQDFRFLMMVQGALRDITSHLEDERPVLAYKRLVELSAIICAEYCELSKRFPHQMN